MSNRQLLLYIDIVTNPKKYVISNQDTATLAVKAAGFGLTLSSTSTPDFSSLFFHICSITIVVVLLYYYPIFVSYLITNQDTTTLSVAAAGFALTLALLRLRFLLSVFHICSNTIAICSPLFLIQF